MQDVPYKLLFDPVSVDVPVNACRIATVSVPALLALLQILAATQCAFTVITNSFSFSAQQTYTHRPHLLHLPHVYPPAHLSTLQ